LIFGLYWKLNGVWFGGCAWCRQDFKPRIHMTDSDFQSIIAGISCPDGQLGATEFDTVMRQQIKHAAQAKLALVGGVRSADDIEFMQFGTLKLILLEQVLYSQIPKFLRCC
jgi:hypothetical protein